MRRCGIVLLLTAVSLWAFACSDDSGAVEETPTTGTIEGTVTLTGDGDVTSVIVSANGRVTTPLVDGTYRITSVTEGQRSVRASLEGYEPVSEMVTVVAGETTTADLSLSPVEDTNRPPIISAFSVAPSVLARSGQADVLVTASDPEGDMLSYTFEVDGDFTVEAGEMPGTATLTAPDTADARGTLRVTVDDGNGGSATAAVLVSTGANRAPMVTSLVASPPVLTAGATASLTASASDPDGDTLTYAWEVDDTAWSIDGTDAMATLTAPDQGGATAVVTLTVTDGDGATGSAQIAVSTTAAGAPVIESLVADPPLVPRAGTTDITVSASDPEGDTLTYTWSGTSGWTIPMANVPILSVTAPDEPSSVATITVEVSDPDGNTTRGAIVVSTAPNAAPGLSSLTASPNPVQPGQDTSVFASATDPDGDGLTYTWTVADASWTVSSGAGTDTLVVTSPTVYDAATDITVTVEDDWGATATGVVPVSTLGTTTNCPVGTADCDGDPSNGCEPTDSGLGQACAATSCLDIMRRYPTSATGTYWIDSDGGSPVNAFEAMCDMDTAGGGWTRILAFDATTDMCLGTWSANASPPPELCTRNMMAGGFRSASIPAGGIPWSQVRGTIGGLQFHSTDAFQTGTTNIDDTYVDGVSITYGSPRNHLWTYASGLSDDPAASPGTCPCRRGTSPPPAVDHDYFCESGNPDPTWTGQWYEADPLWDGDNLIEDCTTTPTSEFTRTIDEATLEDVEIRISADQDSTNEDVGITTAELWVREFEICDGADNDGDGLVDEMGACPSNVGDSCLETMNSAGWVGDGEYWIRPGGQGDVERVYCDMTHDDGGWTLIAVCRPWENGLSADPGTNSPCYSTNQVDSPTDPNSATSAKLSDGDIRRLLAAGQRTTRGFWRQRHRGDSLNPTTAVVFNEIDDPSNWDSEDCGPGGETYRAKSEEVADTTSDIWGISATAYAKSYGPTITTASTGCSCAADGWSNLREDACGTASWIAGCEDGPSMSHCCGCTNFNERADLLVWAR